MSTPAIPAPLSRDDVEDIYPLTPVQEGMLFKCLSSRSPSLYLEQIEWVLHGRIDAEAVAQAWQMLCARHPALRTRFEWRLKRPVQIVLRQVELPTHIHEHTAPLAAPEEASRAYREADMARGMALDTAPLLRLALFREGGARVRVVLSTHHLVLDAWSTRILMREWEALYGHLVNGVPLRLLPAPSFHGVVSWLAQRKTEACVAYWREAARGFAVAGERVPDPAAYAPFALERSLASGTARGLNDAARELKVTPAALVHAAWGAVLSSHRHAPGVVVGTVASGRSAQVRGVEDVVGNMINCVPFLVPVDRGSRVADWVHALQVDHADALDHQNYPMADIRRMCGRGSPHELFDSIVVVQNAGWTQQDLAGTVRATDVKTFGRSEFPLCMRVTPGGSAWKLELLCNGPPRAEGAELLERMSACLEWFADPPGARFAGTVGDMLAARSRSQAGFLRRLKPQPALAQRGEEQ